ncbi:cytidine deaminase [Mucilaginibacter segetis]|uniref:Cytidine deaminase n=1 Tax=Mucilaginibacter segetis TaxID=2793071 RepID=A0A934PTA8_9SPHI|nr:cytidine deaminase [Mucilaginibacter segetis]MBK0380434.1 cytidine deaminase [Mucilaginibacter segetis]
MIKHEIKIAFKEYNAVEELDQADSALCSEAIRALKNSHSPYSKFRVGAAMRLHSGKIIYGSNQENVAYPSGLCAERVALFHWGANHPDDPIESMAITAQTDDFSILKPVTPCGSCLQVLAEYEKMQDKKIKIILYCQNGPVWVIDGVDSLLPFLFFEERLTLPS